MNPAFAADCAAIFAGPLATDAIYHPATGPAVALRVIAVQPDDVANFGTSRFATDTSVFLVPLSAVAAPGVGDEIQIETTYYTVQGSPRRDANRLRWRIEAVAR